MDEWWRPHANANRLASTPYGCQIIWSSIGRSTAARRAIGSLEPLTTLSVPLRSDPRCASDDVLCNEFRHPMQLAKKRRPSTCIGGRLSSAGAGWYELEFAQSGMVFPPPRVRLERLVESVEVLKLLFGGEPVTYDGKHYRLHNAVSRPMPLQRPRPTIWMGGKGDRAIGMIASVADGWNAAWFQDVDAYVERAKLLGSSAVRRSIGQYAQGSAQEMVDRLSAFAAAEVEHAVMCFSTVPFGLDDPDDLARFAQDVLPAVRAL